MAGMDWIKMRTDLYRDPKVCVIADLLLQFDSELSRYVNQNLQRDMAVTRNVMRNVTVGALVSVWGVLRHRGKRVGDDLLIKSCTVSVVDDISELPGFGSAMQNVGWIEEHEDGILLPRFFEDFNVAPEEESKKKNADRQRKYRQRHAGEGNENSNVTVTLQSNAREEKRRDIDSAQQETSVALKRAHQILADFYPDATGIAKAESVGANVAIELEAFRDWHKSKGSTFKDWQAAWRNWLRAAEKFGRLKTGSKPQYAGAI